MPSSKASAPTEDEAFSPIARHWLIRGLLPCKLQAPFSLGSPTGTGIRAAPSAPIGSLGGPMIRAAVGLRLPPGDSPGSTRPGAGPGAPADSSPTRNSAAPLGSSGRLQSRRCPQRAARRRQHDGGGGGQVPARRGALNAAPAIPRSETLEDSDLNPSQVVLSGV